MRTLIVLGLGSFLGCSVARADGVTDLLAAVVYVDRHCPNMSVNKDALASRLHDLGVSTSSQVNDDDMQGRIVAQEQIDEDNLSPVSGCNMFLHRYEDEKLPYLNVFTAR